MVPLPSLPTKHFAKRHEASFIEARRQDLESYLKKLALHPLTSCEHVLSVFLSAGSDAAESGIPWRKVEGVLNERYEDPAIFDRCGSVTAYEDDVIILFSTQKVDSRNGNALSGIT